MGIGLSGMVSGLDTDTLIKQLMSAERTRVTKVENKITKNEWMTEKWKGLNTKIYSFYTGSLSKMKTQGNYLTKKTTSSNESVVKASAGASAPIGTHYVTVEAVASSQYVTSGTFTSDEKLTVKSKLVDAGVAEGTKISFASGDKSGELVVTADTTFADFSEACKNAGLSVNFDENRQCLYINSRQSGKENSFTLTTNSANAASLTAKKGIQELIGYKDGSSDKKAAFDKALATLEASDENGIQAVLDKVADGSTLSADEKELKEAYDLLVSTAKDETADNIAKAEISDEITAKILNAVENEAPMTIYGKEFSADQISTMKAEAERLAKAEEENGDGSQTYEELYENALRALAKDEAEKYITSKDATDALAARKKDILAGTNVSPEVAQAMSDADTAVKQYIATYAQEPTHSAGGGDLSAIGLGDVDGTAVSGGAGGMTVMAASDAKVIVNGATIESSTNSLTVNGLTLDLVSAAPGETISVGVSQNTDGVYDMVKQFVKDYNELLDELNKAYYAESARGYEPLTDEQRDAMSDTEVEKWETKIKDSLLRRDNTIGSLINAMRNTLDQSVSVDGVSYALSSFGICSTKYTEKGKLHIYGDQDDPDGMLYEDKLRKAIEEDPEKVMEVLQTVSKNLYDTMADKMKATELSSALTFYNDKQLTKELTGYKEALDKEEDRLMEIEDRYYKQFASMETALSKLSSQSSSLYSMLGMGQY